MAISNDNNDQMIVVLNHLCVVVIYFSLTAFLSNIQFHLPDENHYGPWNVSSICC